MDWKALGKVKGRQVGLKIHGPYVKFAIAIFLIKFIEEKLLIADPPSHIFEKLEGSIML